MAVKKKITRKKSKRKTINSDTCTLEEIIDRHTSAMLLEFHLAGIDIVGIAGGFFEIAKGEVCESTGHVFFRLLPDVGKVDAAGDLFACDSSQFLKDIAKLMLITAFRQGEGGTKEEVFDIRKLS